jgi:hypothetical protein
VLASEYDLIIVDTLIAALSGSVDENSNTEMGAIGGALRNIARQNDAAVLLVHHTGKGAKEDPFATLRGASALRGSYDVGLILERGVDDREALLHIESRDFEGSQLTVRQAADGGGWELLGSGLVMSKIRAGKGVVKALLEHGDGRTKDDLASLMEKDPSSVFRQLQNAEDGGYVIRKQDPDAAGKPADLWYLNEEIMGPAN